MSRFIRWGSLNIIDTKTNEKSPVVGFLFNGLFIYTKSQETKSTVAASRRKNSCVIKVTF